MRKHRILKTIWHMRRGDDAIDLQVEKKMDCRFENAYSELFTVDHVSDPCNFWIEMPFTFIAWRKIEMISVLCN